MLVDWMVEMLDSEGSGLASELDWAVTAVVLVETDFLRETGADWAEM